MYFKIQNTQKLQQNEVQVLYQCHDHMVLCCSDRHDEIFLTNIFFL